MVILTVDISKVLPDVGLHKSVQEIWQQDLLFDFTIQVGDEEFKVHKVIMASVSQYFRAMLTGGMIESKMDRVKLHGLNSLAVSNILEYIYTNEIKSTKASPTEILACAVYLQMPSAIKAATKMLSNEMNKTNCFDILSTYKTYALKDAAKQTKGYIRSNFDEIMKALNLHDMSHESMLMLIKMWEHSEWDLFLTVKDWVEVDVETRKQHFDELMLKLRFTLMTPAQVGQIKQMELYTSCTGSWCKHVEKSLTYHNAPFHLMLVSDSLPSADVRAKPTPVCFSADAYGTNMMYKLERDERDWGDDFHIPTMPEFTNGAAAVVEMEADETNFLIVCGHYAGTQKWHVFNPRTLTWSPMPSMNTPRADFAIIGYSSWLYVLGGRIGLRSDSETVTDSIERFRFFENKWSTLEMKLPTPLHKPIACSAFGDLYVTAGWETTQRVGDCSTRFDSFEMYRMERPWKSRAPMLVAVPSGVMQAMKCDEVIVVINEDFLMQYYDIEADQWSLWDCKPHMYHKMVWCEHSTVLADEESDTLYFLNFLHDTADSSDSEDDDESVSYQFGYCVKWDLSVKERHFRERQLPDFPIWTFDHEPNVRNAISARLAIQPPSVRKDAPPAAAPSPSGGTRRYNLRKSQN